MSDYVRFKLRIAQGNYHTTKAKAINEESVDSQQAKLRPENYNQLTVQEQFDIDRKLGLLGYSE